MTASQPFDRAAVMTDNSILLIYPPEWELDFRDFIFDRCLPGLKSVGICWEVLDLTHFLFDCFEAKELDDLQADEFRDYRHVRQGLSKRVESGLCKVLQKASQEFAGTNLFVVSTVSLFPLVKFGDVMANLRDLRCRLFIAFPGEERGGKLHFMNTPDGGNYLAVKITIKT
ncbi:MAG: hypothetical protein FJ387_10835 [Verrucomicrobia bacterium]|nr:hypothetical protein [Verrucomicrobiota bacterium]